MKKNTREESLKEKNKQDNEIDLPLNFVKVGNIKADDLNVYIKQDVFNKLEKYSAETTKKEVGSILIGKYLESFGKGQIVISGYIEAKYTDAAAASLTFTHDTWDYIHKEKDKNFKELSIIGWHHTHPNYGIFLSSYDVFIQENFFNLPFQLAYVIDPVQKERGFFQWKNDKVEELKGFYIYDDVGKQIKEPNTVGDKSIKPRKKINMVTVTFALVIVACVVSLYTFFEMDRGKEQQKEEVMALYQLFKAEGQEVIEDSENNQYFEGEIRLIGHKVEKGENIYSICQAYGVDYNESIDWILSNNKIENENRILEGDLIYLPVSVSSKE